MNLAIAWSIFKFLSLLLCAAYTSFAFYTMIADRRKSNEALQNLEDAQKNMESAQKRMEAAQLEMEAAQLEMERVTENSRLSLMVVKFGSQNTDTDIH